MATDIRQLELKANRAAKNYIGGTAWPTVLLGIGSIALYSATIVFVIAGHLPLWIGFVVNSLLVYAIYTVMHEAVHGNICGTDRHAKWINDVLGYVAGFMLAIPYKIHRAEHFAHHRDTNSDSDPDQVFSGHGAFDVVWGSFKAIPNQYKFYFSRVWPRASRPDKRTIIAEILVMNGARVALALAGFPLEALLLTVLANIAGNLITVTFFAWMVHYPHTEEGRYVDTSTYVFPKWINMPITWLWLFQNYHSIHHLFPRVPFFKYKDVFDEIRDVMEAMGAPIYDVGTKESQTAKEAAA